ncbi:MAG TPA: polyribonucleotide nucleotidyltransferase [Elusimicrobia bacterium]|nr:polyribonucleotide nucleotidyltransferase [Elusimicrobiota bacterium]HBT60921.1 polyribonucleotide nucleotidyltransferase [Elusimicrobiota bacterium]
MADNFQKICLQETVGGKIISLQTGTIAKQAGGSATAHLGETVTLSAATAAATPRTTDFVPLTSEYRERTYAAGRIPGGFFKRETRPREKEILSSRLVDRPIRPLFPKSWRYETMIHTIVLSSDLQNDADVLAINSASAALMLSDIPFNGPVAAVRIARINGQIVLFPTFEERDSAEMELVVAGKKGALLMVEGSASEVPEDDFIQALEAAAAAIDKLCDLQIRLAAASEAAGRKIVKREIPKIERPAAVVEFVSQKAREPIIQVLRAKHPTKESFSDAIDAVHEGLAKELSAITDEASPLFGGQAHCAAIVDDVLQKESRRLTLEEGLRPDGRKFDEIRPISIQLSVLPRLHGSVIFTRGQTQSLVCATLGTPGDMQIMDELEGEYKERFLLHYNFPGFSVGEVKPERGPGRREIGHGALARRSLAILLPAEEQFAYTIRLVSEIMESNGSSSMASVCGGSLALFDAGVPMKAPCAGIAMGLVLEGEKYAILTDIAGVEDHNGDLDFKVAGTAKGITGFQMDMKVEGLKISILKEALEQARRGRLFILDKMTAAIAEPRKELSPFAPRLMRLQIPVDKIGALIGPGGKNIRRMIETYGVEIDVEDDGSVFIAGVEADGCAQAQAEVEALTKEAEVGQIYKGRVVSIKEFGAFVEIFPGREGLLHISQIDVKRVARVEDALKEGDEVDVKVLEIDNDGKIRLSRKAVLAPGSEGDSPRPPRREGPGDRHRHREGGRRR